MSHRPQFTTDDRPYEEWRAHRAAELRSCYDSIQLASYCWDLVDAAHPDPAERKEAYAAINRRMDAMPRGDLAMRDGFLREQVAMLEKRLGMAPAAPEPEPEPVPVWYRCKVVNARLAGSARFVRYHEYSCRRENGSWLLVNVNSRTGTVLSPDNAARALEAVRDKYGNVLRADDATARAAEALVSALLLA